MLHIWTPERLATASVSDNLAMDAPSVEDLRRNHALDGADEWEFVLGRRQVASLSFVVLVLISVFSGISYLVGRTTLARAIASAPPAKPVVEAAKAAPVAPPPVVVPEVQPEPKVNTDVFGTPIVGALYIQTGAVERGVATIMAEGLRTHGLPALVGPGPNDRIFRVLVGPFPSAAELQQAKESLEIIGLTAFAQFQK
jgi:cell division septation protein DedD